MKSIRSGLTPAVYPCPSQKLIQGKFKRFLATHIDGESRPLSELLPSDLRFKPF
jgi:hypothetical protein